MTTFLMNILLIVCASAGAVAGLLWAFGRSAVAFLPIGGALGSIAFVLVSQTPQSGISEDASDVLLQLGALLFWALAVGALTRLVQDHVSERIEHRKQADQRLASASKRQRTIESDLERLKGQHVDNGFESLAANGDRSFW